MRNYKIKTYARKGETYHTLLCLKPKNSFAGKEMKILDMTYEEVKIVVRDLGKKFTWEVTRDIFETCYKITPDDFWNAKIVDFYASFNFIVQEFEKIVKREVKLLSSIESVDTVLWEQADSKKLNKHSTILPLIQLGKIFGQYPIDLKDKKYQEILVLLTAMKDHGEVESKYNELKSQVK